MACASWCGWRSRVCFRFVAGRRARATPRKPEARQAARGRWKRVAAGLGCGARQPPGPTGSACPQRRCTGHGARRRRALASQTGCGSGRAGQGMPAPAVRKSRLVGHSCILDPRRAPRAHGLPGPRRARTAGPVARGLVRALQGRRCRAAFSAAGRSGRAAGCRWRARPGALRGWPTPPVTARGARRRRRTRAECW